MKKSIRTLLIVMALLLIGIGALTLMITAQKEQLSALESAIVAIKEAHVPIRFRVESRAEGMISMKMRLYNMDGEEIATATHRMAGESLFFDFVSVPVAKRYLAFPKAVFTEAVPASKGFDLFPLYDNEGFPQVFAAKGMDKAVKADLGRLFTSLKKGRRIDGAFGNAVHDVKAFKTFELGVVYKVISRLKGGLEIVEDTP